MIYSEWTGRDYIYFQDARADNQDLPMHLKRCGGCTRKVGMTIGEAAWPKPVGVRRVGRGSQPRGRIVGRNVALGDDTDTNPALRVGMYIGGAVLIGYALRWIF